MVSINLKQAELQFTDRITAALKSIPFTELNQPLYHFTDKAGLFGILRSRSLWASLATALNDTSEIEYALFLGQRILQLPETNSRSSFLEEIVPLLNPRGSATINILGMNTYVVSFCTSTDESTQWLTYGRSGTGFALAFGPKPLVIPGLLLIPVLYDPSEQDKVLREFIQSSAKLYGRLAQECAKEDSEALRQRAIHWTAFGLWVLAPAMKAPAFQGEREWRLIVVDFEHVQTRHENGVSKETRMRRSNNRDIPYKVLEYSELPIVGLELGASAAEREDDPELRGLLYHATRRDNVPIMRSHVPVRP